MPTIPKNTFREDAGLGDVEMVAQSLPSIREYREFVEVDPSCLVTVVPVQPDDLPRIGALYPGVVPDEYTGRGGGGDSPRLVAVHLLRRDPRSDVPRKVKLYVDAERGGVVREFKSRY
ncbi:MAG: hypothetical protein ACTSU5_02595 [Promethearchaeota archaeon]